MPHGMWDLSPWPGIEPAPSSVEFRSYNPGLLGKSRALCLCVLPLLILMMTPQLGVAINHKLRLRGLGNLLPTIAKMQSLVLLTSSPSSLSCCSSICHRIGSYCIDSACLTLTGVFDGVLCGFPCLQGEKCPETLARISWISPHKWEIK